MMADYPRTFSYVCFNRAHVRVREERIKIKDFLFLVRLCKVKIMSKFAITIFLFEISLYLIITSFTAFSLWKIPHIMAMVEQILHVRYFLIKLASPLL